MKYLILVIVLLASVTVNAQDPVAIQPSLNFLTISPDARASGMGMNGVATSPDNFSAIYNPAKLSRTTGEYGFAVAGNPYLNKIAKGMGLITLAGYRKLDEESKIGVDVRFFQLGKVNFKDEVGYDLYSYNPSELAISLTYSRKLSDFLNAGVSLRYINSRLATGFQYQGEEIKSVGAVGGDVGIYYTSVSADEISSGGYFTAGAAIQNIGSKVRYYSASEAQPQPTTFKGGFGYAFRTETEHSFTVNAEINKILITGYKPIGISAGMEYSHNTRFFLRGGVYYQPKEYSNRQLVTAGVGYAALPFNIDFSYNAQVSTGTISNTNVNSFNFSLGFNIISE